MFRNTSAMFRIAKENASRSTWTWGGTLGPHAGRVGATLRRAAAALCAGVLGLLPVAGMAQQSVVAQQNAVAPERPPGFYIGTQLLTAYDTNVARQAPGPYVIGTQIDQAALFTNYDHTYERQHVYFAADVGRNVYREFPLYDYTSQDMNVGLQSNFPFDISSDVKVSRYVTLANQSDFQGLQRNVLSENRIDGWLRLPLAASWRAVLAAGAGRLRNSNALDVPTDVNAVQLEAGVRYEAGTDNYVNVLGRSLQARYPDLDLLPANTLLPLSPFHERGADVETKWRFSGSSQVIGNVGYVSRRSENAQVYWRNFSGPAYDLTYLWTPGAKFRFTLLLLRATGEPGDNDYLSAVKHTVRVTPAYLPTDHLRLEAQWEWNSIKYVSIPASAIPAGLVQALGSQAAELASRSDILSNEGVAAVWTPERWLQVRLSFLRQVRGSDIQEWNYADRLTQLRVQARF